MGRAIAIAWVLLLGALPLAGMAGAAGPARDPVPVLAHYYIWFNPTSWNRAKTDYPLLGRYSSDDDAVMLRHIRLAKQAGIDGFIVSWKSTPLLNRRLAKLARLARAENFKLAIVYQGLDFFRNPLPAERIRHDLNYFAKTYGHDRAFLLFGRPVVAWSGTWNFSRAEIAAVTKPVRQRLLVLAMERSVDSYEDLADLVAGNAYYWSSVNPVTYPDHGEKLAEMGRAVHRRGGLWIAPAAPGFDARLVGGNSVVPRLGGKTFRRELDAAFGSSPDAVGVISWNEFSENTHIEPSRRYGVASLNVLADVLGAHVTLERDFDFDSSEAASTVGYATPFLVGCGLVFVTGIGAVFWRRQLRRNRGTQAEDKGIESRGRWV
jgi:hypothetical protein